MALYQAYLTTCQENLKRFKAIFLDFPIRFNVSIVIHLAQTWSKHILKLLLQCLFLNFSFD